MCEGLPECSSVLRYNLSMACSWCSLPLRKRSGALTCSVRCRVAKSRVTFPEEMRALPNWLRHKSKAPWAVANYPGSSTNPKTWSSFDYANKSTVGDGLGFTLNGDGIACIDLDHCIVDGMLDERAQLIVDCCRSTFIEVSLSGTGLHVFGRAVVGKGFVRNGVEVYDRGRFIAVTGRRFKKCPLVLSDISDVISCL